VARCGLVNHRELRVAAVSELDDVLAAQRSRKLEMPEEASLFSFAWAGSSIDHNRFSRVVDMGKRLAMVLAVCSGKNEVDYETAQLGVAFINYQIAAYNRLMPADSTSQTQTYENRIIAFFERHPRSTHPEARNNIKPERSPGGHIPFNRAFDGLVRAGKLKQVGQKRRGTQLWQLDD